ncbi:MAG TPA: hypothetical protein VOA78_08510 [Candidatus Dormibacteraeota bacterium]|nr:hypothetical protein [Candidatus Dormibacteraeota bacterium]
MLSPEPAWYIILHRTLECLYYVSGIAVAVLVAFGLRQIRITSEQLRLTKEIAELAKKRESVKFAAAQCSYFAATVVPQLAQLNSLCHASKVTCFDLPRREPNIPLTISEIDRPHPSFDLKQVQAPWDHIGYAASNCLNSLESFAIPFAAGVADDAVGFQETSALFCDSIHRYLPMIWHIRLTQDARYPSALTLYCNWENRRQAERAAPLVKRVQALAESIDKNKIEPI